MDEGTTVGDLKALVRGFVEERDWVRYHNPKDLSMAIAVEAAELQEIFLWKDPKDCLMVGDMRSRTEDEIADILIYCLSFAALHDIDLSECVRRKVDLNRRRYPPDKVAGRAVKHTEL